MTKAELESKHIAELHVLAAEAGVERYRMLSRGELVEKLLEEKSARGGRSGQRQRSGERERSQRRRRERPERQPSAERANEQEPAPVEPVESVAEPEREPSPQRRKRRRRRLGRKGKGLRPQDLLLPPPGRQALVYGESRDACTALLREIATELGEASKGPDPIALLVDPSPEELADWRREAPQAEIVAAGKSRHATDALAQARRRAEEGEDVILLVDSLSKLDDTDTAREIFDAGLTQARGSLTVVAALERPA